MMILFASSKRLRPGGHLVPEDLVSDAAAAEIVLVSRDGIFGRDLPRRQVHAQSFAGPASVAHDGSPYSLMS
jgi:hypothetical protein